MKTITFTEFRNSASEFIDAVEHGETLLILRHGKPVAEIVPYSDTDQRTPAWKESGSGLRIKGGKLSTTILEDRKDAR